MKSYIQDLTNNKSVLSNTFDTLEQDLTDHNYFSANTYKIKNNFNDVLAGENTRVKLQKHRGDYINANYVLQNYIATQQPNDHTIDDFWTMIYQTNSRMIINLSGNNNYLPHNYIGIYDDISVKIKEIKTSNYASIRNITLTQNNITKEIYHVTYLTWPDYGVPDENEFIKLFNEINFLDYVSNTGPIVVHCRAGIGRTGSFIMIHHIFKKIEHRIYPDPIQIVKYMRQSRSGMIQSKSQFEFVLSVITKQLVLKLDNINKGKRCNLSSSCGYEIPKKYKYNKYIKNNLSVSSEIVI